MKVYKLLIGCILVCVVSITLIGCRNNLVNNWENYTGDTDVYYKDPNITSGVETPSDTAENNKSVSAYGLPDYWEDELLTAVTESNRVMNEAKGDVTTFLWYNDAHLSYSARRSGSILKYLQDRTNIRFVNFGGDIVSDNNEVEHNEIISQLNDWREETLELYNHHSVVGNHDDDIEEFSNRQDLYDFLIGDEVEKITDENNKFCYYVDNPTEKTRYIYLSTGFDETTGDDINFLVNTLNSTQMDWHIVLVSHIWFVYNSTETPTEGYVPDFAKVILDVIDAYNAHATGITSGVYYDFSSAGARVEFCIGGHIHVDFDFRTDGGIPVILNETDSYHLRGDNKSLHETDEASVSVIIADYDNRVVNIIRAGRGESREVPLSNDR